MLVREIRQYLGVGNTSQDVAQFSETSNTTNRIVVVQFATPTQRNAAVVAANMGFIANVLSAAEIVTDSGSPAPAAAGGNTGAIVGGVVGGIIGIVIIIFVVRRVAAGRQGALAERFDDDFVMASQSNTALNSMSEMLLITPHDDDDDGADKEPLVAVDDAASKKSKKKKKSTTRVSDEDEDPECHDDKKPQKKKKSKEKAADIPIDEGDV